jgi:hypothetical protein
MKAMKGRTKVAMSLLQDPQDLHDLHGEKYQRFIFTSLLIVLI